MATTRGLASLQHLKSGGGVKSGVHVQVSLFSYPPKKTLANCVVGPYRWRQSPITRTPWYSQTIKARAVRPMLISM